MLFLCTGNSARSILAEQILNRRGGGRFHAYSAGSHPKGAVNPLAIRLLGDLRLPTDGLRSKGWEEFAAPGAPPIDAVITVCDDAAGETCPVWPGAPITAHWGVEDPASVSGSDPEKRQAFDRAYRELDARIEALVNLPIASLDRPQLEERLRRIGRMHGDREA